MISVSFSSLQIDNISCIIAATIFLRQKMFIYIFAKFWSKTWIALLTIKISSIKRKNVLWWKISCWLTVWSVMSIISLKSSIFFWWNLDETQSFIFHQWVQTFFDINEEFQQLKHHQSHLIFIIVLFFKVKSIFALISNSLSSKIIIFVTVVLTVSSSFSFSFLNESMNLNFVVVIV